MAMKFENYGRNWFLIVGGEVFCASTGMYECMIEEYERRIDEDAYDNYMSWTDETTRAMHNERAALREEGMYDGAIPSCDRVSSDEFFSDLYDNNLDIPF